MSCQGHKVGYAGLRKRVENENMVCVRSVSPGRSTVVRKRGMVRGVRKMLRFQTKTRAAVVHGPILTHEGAVWRPPAPAQVRLVARAARRLAARRPVHPRPRRPVHDRALRPHGTRRHEASDERPRRFTIMYTINPQQRATSCKTPEIETPLKPPIAAAQGQFGGKMEVGPEGFEPSTHGLRVRPGWSENRASAPINGNFPKTVSHMLPREVDLTPLKRKIFG